jgi:hypothetical protein
MKASAAEDHADGDASPATIASMYSIPLIVAPAAAVGTGSCQTSLRSRLLSGSASARPARRRPRSLSLLELRGVDEVGGDLGLGYRDPLQLAQAAFAVSKQAHLGCLQSELGCIMQPI